MTRRAGGAIAVCAVVLAAVLALGRTPVSSAASTGVCPPGVTDAFYCAPPQITATMQWTFAFTPRYTRVLTLAVGGASRTTVLVKCRGRGCPYRSRSRFVATTTPCGKKGKQTCPTHGSLHLAPAFRNRRLRVGTRLSVAITRSGWVGKYYTFKIRAGHAPQIGILCLAPGKLVPTGAC